MRPLELHPSSPVGRTIVRIAAIVLAAWLLLALGAERALAASSKGCVGSGFSVVLPTGQTLAGEQRGTVPAAALGDRFSIRGTYVEFDVQTATFGVLDYTLTGAANPLDMTGGRRTPVFASKTPDLGGARLTGDMSLRLREDRIELIREGAGVSMKIQAKDCAQGGIFQMEPEREDGAPTIITHTLADGVFYFDNPFFRERIGQVLNGVEVSARVNFANDVSPSFVGRDSPQVAEKVSQTATTTVWSVASGGRMGGVLGEDAVEVAPPSTECVEDCQAQNQVRGRFVVLGFPFPVPAASRITDAGTPAGPVPAAVVAPAAAGGAGERSGGAGAIAGATAPAGQSGGALVAVRAPSGAATRHPAEAGGARVVRVTVYRLRGGRRTHRVATMRRAVKAGRSTLRIRFASGALAPGRYELEARGARGGATRAKFTVGR
jgi:hypothetical protein